jgi:transcriptional regulator with XRE-family HTH domain
MNDFIGENTLTVDINKTPFSTAEIHTGTNGAAKTTFKTAENTEATIKRLLSTYDLGNKLRQLRVRRKIALIDLGRYTGLSASMLSQLENGKLIPTLPTLTRIAMVFDVGLEFFFSDKKPKRLFSIVRAGQRTPSPDAPENPIPGHYFELLTYAATDRALAAYMAEFPKLENHNAKQHSHEGSEFVHVLGGDLSIFYQNEQHVLHAGDSLYFDSSETHSYQGHSEVPTKAIVVTTPPRL